MIGVPKYPLTVFFSDDGEKWILENEAEVANNLEWFDSDDPEEKARVTDKNGRMVRLLVKNLEVVELKLNK